MTRWQAFWQRILSVETARFILALVAVNYAAGSVLLLMTGYAQIDPGKEALVNFALGQMFALAMIAFHRYFGNSREETASGKIDDPVHYEEDPPHPRGPLPRPEFGKE